MDYSLNPWSLTWDDVDPGRHPFAAATVASEISRLPPASAVPTRPSGKARDGKLIDWARDDADAWADAMARAVVERFGLWACGWRWAIDEGDFGGGPVHSWCCAMHSISEPKETLKRVADALIEWRLWLEDLAKAFDHFPLEGLSAADQVAVWERGAVHLIHRVVDRTGAGDAWYGHCAQVLTWFLVRWGVAGDRAKLMVGEAIGGRFDSWIGPDNPLIEDVAGRLARSAGAGQPGPDRG